jgi:hypothetical protein
MLRYFSDAGERMMLAATTAVQWISTLGVKRDIVGSDIVIIVALAIHAGEGITLALTNRADWSIPMHMLTWRGHTIAAIVILISVSLGIIGQWVGQMPLLFRIVFLFPQWTLLLMTAGAALRASVMGEYVNFTPPSGIGIFWDQVWRIAMPVMYFFAAWARVQAR